MKDELLLVEEIEERILSVKREIELLNNKNSYYMNMFNTDPQFIRKFVNDNNLKLQQLKADLGAYETAIEYVS